MICSRNFRPQNGKSNEEDPNSKTSKKNDRAGKMEKGKLLK